MASIRPMLPNVAMRSVFGILATAPFGALPLRAQDPAPGTQPTTPPPATTPMSTNGLQWQLGDYVVKLGGYVKVDLIHDFNEIGSTDNFDPRTIPVTNDEGTNTRVHARSTRLHLDVAGPTSAGPMRIYVEGDFFGDNNAFRLRHAFGTVAGVLGGQTWSTFMDEDCMPETLDYDSPIAYPLIRQGQIRYTKQLEGGSYWAIALEDPASTVITG